MSEIMKSSNIENELSNAMETENNKKRYLKFLIDQEKIKDSNRILVTKISNINFTSFIGSLSFKKLAQIGKYAHNLPTYVLKTKKNREGKIIGIEEDKDTIDFLLQRPVDYSRQYEMVDYLLHSKENTNKFPPITVVITTKEAMEPNNDNFYNAQKRSLKDSIKFEPIDSNGDIGFLDISEQFYIFALDGQHRLLSFKGLQELLDNPKLELNKKTNDGIDIKKNTITLSEYELNSSDIDQIFNQEVGVEFIPGVVAGETFDESIERMRNLFIDYNDNQKPMGKPTLTQLKSEFYAEVAKEAYKKHPLLSRIEVVDPTKANPSANSKQMTTLVSMAEAAEQIYKRSEFFYWQDSKKIKSSSKNEIKKYIEKYYSIFEGFLDSIYNLPSIKEFLESPEVVGSRARDFRNFTDKTTDLETGTKGRGHLLFRNAGVKVLAKTYNELVVKKYLRQQSEGENLSADDTIKILTKEEFNKKIEKLDKLGGLENIDKEKSIFYGNVYNFSKRKMDSSINSVDLASKILVYMLGKGDREKKDLDNLREKITEKRAISEKYVIDYNGKPQPLVKSLDGAYEQTLDLPQRIN
jgi:hypothetical protein